MNRADLNDNIVARLVRLPEPHQAHYGVVPPSPPLQGIPVGLAGQALADATSALGEIKTIVETMKDSYLVSRVLVGKEAVSSSAIEGTNSTLDELLQADAEDDDGASAETRQVRDYALTLQTLLPVVTAEGPKALTLGLIQQAHRNIMRADKDYKDVPGAWRQRVVWIGGSNINHSSYNPPPPDRVAECLQQHAAYLKNDDIQSQTQGLITRMSVAHAHFEAIHPFRDGNGRVGRLLLPLMMAADGQVPLYLSPYIEANKQGYYMALKAAQQREDHAELIGYLSQSIIETVREVKKMRADLAALITDLRGSAKIRKNSAADRILDILHEYPVLTLKRAPELIDSSTSATNVALNQLVAAGILKERTGYRRHRVYAAEAIIKIMNRPFGS